ncbi:MAG: PQQ-binding-like beta-propeller repeat protein [Pirellulaceae bacterium]|nr:PQQ-binding-like beta-propeller repeat protein [Pirellulaceae bacterium]
MFKSRAMMLQIAIHVLGLSLFNVAFAQEIHEMRTWTDATGQHKTVAQFVELRGTNVTLKLENGESIKIALDKLSSDDRKVARLAAKDNKPKPVASTPLNSGENEVNSGENEANSHATAATTDWAQWRGPNRDGISTETGLLKSWPDDGPPVAFQAEGLGNGFASVSIAEGRLFTMGKFGDETRLVALDANNGNLLWQAPVGNGGDGPNCTPTVDGELVYALSFAGDLICAEASTGKAVWRTSFPNDFGGRMMSSWGYSESPLVDGDNLIVTPGAQDAALAALNKKTGRVAWRTPMPANPGQAGQDGAGYSSVVISNAGGVRQYVQFVGRGIIGVEAKTGKFLWGYNRIANGTANIPTPIVSGDLIFCSSGYDDGGSALLRISEQRKQFSVSEVWYKRANDLQNHHGGMILLGDQVFMGHGHNNGFPVCFDLKTGRDRWRPGRGAGTGSAAITYADGRFYFRYENGTMALLDADSSDYFERGRFRIGINNGQSWPHPVISDGKLYLRDQHQLIVYDIRQK